MRREIDEGADGASSGRAPDLLPYARPARAPQQDNVRLADRIRSREEIADEIERLIDALDFLDGDPDLEPSLGGQPSDATPDLVDIEGDFADDEPAGDEHEPSLGSIAAGERDHQGNWSRGSTNDGEPSLGSVATYELRSQCFWAQGSTSDHELDDSDEELTGDDEPSLGSFRPHGQSEEILPTTRRLVRR